jgi:hypothetical protein
MRIMAGRDGGAYDTPVLTRLGKVVELTQASMAGSRMDDLDVCAMNNRQSGNGTFC